MIEQHIYRNGAECINLTGNSQSEWKFTLLFPEATSAKFYLGNDQKVLLQIDANAKKEESTSVFSVALKASDFAEEGKGLFFFHWEAETPHGRVYTYCDNNRLQTSDRFVNEFQLTIYREIYASPEWLKNGVFYQVFVDRFFSSGKAERKKDAVYNGDWDHGIPEYASHQGESFPNNTHFGGDLYGVAEKLDYLEDLGVSCIYLSPVCDAFSNHKYDTGDYLHVDQSFGGDDALKNLCCLAHQRGMHVILDGVFNHVGDDSIYFNRYGKYNSVGAYQSPDSPYAFWFSFGETQDQYDSWWGVKNLPKTVKNDSFRNFICQQVIPKYMNLGADGFRLDVVDELDNRFMREIAGAIKSCKPDAAVIGEVWEDASCKTAYGERKSYFQGEELDGVMNYPFRNGMLSFLMDGDASLLYDVVETLFCHYPPDSLAYTMNFLGTHDTERILTVLGGEPDYGEENAVLAVRKMSDEQRKTAKEKLLCGYALLSALPGIPCIYYGDEAGMEGYHDPFNRRPFPWKGIDWQLHDGFRAVNECRRKEPLFSAEQLETVPMPEGLFACKRICGRDILTVVSNLSGKPYTMQFECPQTELLSGEYNLGKMTIDHCRTVFLRSERQGETL